MNPGTPPPPEIPDHTLLEVIGRGSYGEVWLARNTVGTMRAVKVIRRAQFDSARPYEREFTGLQKYEPLSRSHEGLMDILHVGRNDSGGYFYYVMELADEAPEHPALDSAAEGSAITMEERLRGSAAASGPGTVRAPLPAPDTKRDASPMRPRTGFIPRTLRTEIKSCGRLSAEDCLRHFISLAGALEHLHRHGLIHRDVKPSNIIFVGGVAKLADIGLVAEMSESRSFVGTEGFIPLEGPGTAQADVYSLGKVLYEAVTGLDRLEFPSLPLGKGELGAQRAMIELNAVSMKACAPRAAERYQSAAEMMADLALMQSGRSVQDQHRTVQRLRLARRISTLAGAAALLAAGGWAVQTWRSRLERDALTRTTEALARAESAERKTRDALYVQALALAAAESVSPRLGRRFRALDAIRAVARDHPDDLDLRNAAITALALPDMRETGVRKPPATRQERISCSDPACRRLALTGPDGVTRVFLTSGGPDPSQDQQVAEWTSPASEVTGNGPFSLDGALLAQYHADKTVSVREVATGAVRLTVPAEVASMAMRFWGFTDDGADFWVMQERSIRLYPLRGGPGTVIDLPAAVDTGGSHTREGVYAFAARNKDYIVLVDIPQRRVAGVQDMGGQAFCCAVSPCGQWLLAGSGDGTVRRMALREAGTPVISFPVHTGAITSLAFHPEGDWFLTFSWDSTMSQVDTWSGTRLATGGLSGHLLAWDGGGDRLAWRELMSGDVVFCEAAGRAVCRAVALPESARTGRFVNIVPAFSDSGSHLLVTGYDGVRVFETPGGTLSGFIGMPGVRSLLPAGKGRFLAATPRGVQYLQREGDESGSPVLRAEPPLHGPAGRFHLTVSRDGKTAAALLNDEVWIFPEGSPPRMLEKSSEFRTVTLSPDGSWIAIRGSGTDIRPVHAPKSAHHLPLGGAPAFFGNPLRIIGARQTESAIECYDAASGARLWSSPLSRVLGLDTVVSPDETLAAVVTADRVVLLECATGRQLGTLQHPSRVAVFTAAFSPDSSRLAVSTPEGAVQIWDLRLLRQGIEEAGLAWRSKDSP